MRRARRALPRRSHASMPQALAAVEAMAGGAIGSGFAGRRRVGAMAVAATADLGHGDILGAARAAHLVAAGAALARVSLVGKARRRHPRHRERDRRDLP